MLSRFREDFFCSGSYPKGKSELMLQLTRPMRNGTKDKGYGENVQHAMSVTHALMSDQFNFLDRKNAKAFQY